MLTKLTLFTICTFLLCTDVGAQHGFFRSIELSPFVYFDRIRLDNDDWAGLIAGGSLAKSPHDLKQGATYSSPFEGGSGLQLRSLHGLNVFRANSDKRLDMSLGIGYRSLRFGSAGYETPYDFPDTAKTYLYQDNSFRFRNHMLDVSSSLMLSLYSPPEGRFHLSVGLGFRGGVVVGKSTMIEYYKARVVEYVPPGEWRPKTGFDTVRIAPARRLKQVGFTVPGEFGVRISKHLELNGRIEYVNTMNFGRVKLSSSEGVYFLSSIRFFFHQH